MDRSDAPRPSRQTIAMAQGLVQQPNTNTTTTSSSRQYGSGNTTSQYGAPPGTHYQSAGDYYDEPQELESQNIAHRYSQPPRIGLQRFDTAKEEIVHADGAPAMDGHYDEPTAAPPPSLPARSAPREPESQRAQLDRGYSLSAFSTSSKQSIPPPGSVLTGKQEHCMFPRHG